MNGVKPTGSESERDFLIEVISWGEDIDTGRWGYDRAAEMLDGYVAARVAAIEAERDEAQREARQCGARHPSNPTVVPCRLAPNDHEDGLHRSSTGCAGSAMSWPTAEAERDEARARLAALLEAISMLGKGEVAAYGRAAARGDS